MMKIAYVSREFGSITGGGIGTYIANVTRYMAQRGHEVYLVTDCFNNDNLHFLPAGVNLIHTKPVFPERQGCYFTWLHEYSDRVYQTLKDLSQQKLDVIEFAEYGAEGFITIRAKKLLNEFAHTKLIVKLHTPSSLLVDINEEKFRSNQTAIHIYAEEYSIKNADLVTSPSDDLADYYRKKLGLSIYKSLYPLELTTHTQPRQFTENQIHKVVFVGGIQVRKGVDFLIEAAKLVLAKEPNFIFEIYGRDTESAPFCRSYLEYLQKRIPPEWQTKILFKGAVPYTQVAEIFQNSCFCVFPSRWENWPNVCLEAMSLGCVVIGSKYGGMSEMIQNGVSGFLIDPYKAEEIAYAILDNCRNHSYLQQISANAQSAIKQWSDPDIACQQIESGYQIEVSTKQWTVNREPKVSVIIPLYNQGQYVQEAIDSIKASTYKNTEIIIVNDGSTDDRTNQIFEQLTGVIKVNKLNGGLSSARNVGIAASTGEFILPLDADDKIHPNYIDLAVQALINNTDLSYLTCYTKNFQAFENTYIPVGFVPELMLILNTDGKCTNLYRKTAIASVNGFDEEMISYEDWDFLISLHENDLHGDVLPLELFYYRRSYDSMVYTVANPKRAQLIQYMLFKHSKLFAVNAEAIAQHLVQLWKQREIEVEWLYDCKEREVAAAVQPLQQRIIAMETSKFWQFRKLWFNVKRKLRLTQEEP